MKQLDNLDLWAGRLPIWRSIEALVVAAVLAIAATLFVPRSAWAGEPDGNVVVTAAALEKTAEAQIETAKVLKVLAERMTGGGLTAAPQAAIVNPAAKTCDGFGSCLLGVFKAVTEGVGDVTRAVAPIAAPYYGYKGAVVAADAQKVGFIEATKQAGLREATTQAGFQTAASIAGSGNQALIAIASQPAVPTTAVTVNGNGPVNTGTGTITNASNNPITTTQPPVVVVGTTGTTVSRGP